MDDQDDHDISHRLDKSFEQEPRRSPITVTHTGFVYSQKTDAEGHPLYSWQCRACGRHSVWHHYLDNAERTASIHASPGCCDARRAVRP